MDYIKKIVYLAIISAIVNASNATDEKPLKEVQSAKSLIRTQDIEPFNFNDFSDEGKVMVLSFITELKDIQNCMLVCKFFEAEFKRLVINRMDIQNVCYQTLPPFFVKFVLNLPKEEYTVQERMQGGIHNNIMRQKIIYNDKYDNTFEITGGKVCIDPIWGYLKIGNFDSLLFDLNDADLHTMDSYHKRDGGGCFLRSRYEGLITQGWVVTFMNNKYYLFANQIKYKK